MTIFLDRFKYAKLRDIPHLFLFVIALPIAFFLRCFHRDIWLLGEDVNEARDNAYWLFKYLREKHPEIEAYYVINKKCPDAKKVSKIGKVIPYGGMIHWIYYLASSRKISSQKGCKPNAAICYVLENSGLMRNKRIFLQHGITKDDAKWLYYDVCKFALFVTAVKREQIFVEQKFGYSGRNIVKCLGFCRFDNLHNAKYMLNNKQILVMPTWRDWISRPVSDSKDYDDMSSFTTTEFFKVWNSFLHNKRLYQLLNQYGLTLVFFPHRKMQDFIAHFKIDCANIVIPDFYSADIQHLLMESVFLITDYSSVFMDFAYMKKALIYYQFDYVKYRSRHYQEGYFSYKDDGFGEICSSETDLLRLLNDYCKTNFELKDYYRKRIDDFFTLNDNNNCERNFLAIKNL